MKKYMVIYNDIYDDIKKGKLQSGDKLPSEQEFMDKYDVSRYTVRRAMDLLQEKGFIQKNQGAASTITHRDPFSLPISEIFTFQEVNELEDLEATTIVENLEIIRDRKLVKKLFGIDRDEEVYKVVRSREIHGEKVILDIDYFRREVIPNLPLIEAQNSIYRYLEEDLHMNIGYAIKQFYAERPTEMDMELLDLDGYNVVVVVQSQTFLSDNTIFQYTLSRHRPDRFKFVDIAKRKIE